MANRIVMVCVLVCAVACGDDSTAPDADMLDGGTDAPMGVDAPIDAPTADDSGTRDSGTDGGVRVDSGPPPVDSCPEANVLCVDDDPGPNQEFEVIQDAVDAAGPGDVVLVFEGAYAGFRFDDGGDEGNPITVRAVGMVDLTSPAEGVNNRVRFQNVSHITVDGFRIACDGTENPYDYDYSAMAARGATVSDPMDGLVVRNMEISGCSPGAFYCSQCRGIIIEGNYMHDNVPHAGGDGMAIYLSNAGCDDAVVIGNRFEDNAGAGIHLNGDLSIGGDGIQTGHYFEGNTFSGNGTNGLNFDGVQSVTIINNIFGDNGRHAIRGYAIDGAEGPSEFVVINNTMVSNTGTGLKLSEDEGGHVIFNNLMADNGEAPMSIEESSPMLSNNLDVDLADLRGPGSRDYHLADGSSAVGAGVASFGGHDAPAEDFEGSVRASPPSVGAYE